MILDKSIHMQIVLVSSKIMLSITVFITIGCLVGSKADRVYRLQDTVLLVFMIKSFISSTLSYDAQWNGCVISKFWCRDIGRVLENLFCWCMCNSVWHTLVHHPCWGHVSLGKFWYFNALRSILLHSIILYL